ncbi:AMP-binding protein [Actinokineospora sp.]|uniref:AMP-binding protein n=1 Tax=Actinokineospora sp. TaxID=1872133 RepID=UPI003D6AF94E
MPSVATATTLTSQLTTWATLDPHGAAVAFLDFDTAANGSQISLTWLELDRRVAAVAVSLSTQVSRGEPVAVLVDQSLDYVVAFLAVLRAGAVAVPLVEPDSLARTSSGKIARSTCRARYLAE